MEQDIRFCRTSDEIRIAYAVTGSGYPLVWVPGWVSHLELMWEMELTRASFEALSRDFTLIRLDKRGTGLSQRGVTDFSWDARARDVEAVAKHAGLERFALYGISEGCTGALQFAADHPEQVSHLILQGAAAPNAHTADLLGGVVSVIKAEWGLGSKLMSDVLLGENAPPELERWFARLQREGATADAGDVIREEANVYGGAVNIASRVCALSAPGEILVSDVVRGMARSSAGPPTTGGRFE